MKQIISEQLANIVGGRMRENASSGGRAKSFNERNNTGGPIGGGSGGGCTGGRRSGGGSGGSSSGNNSHDRGDHGGR